MTHGTMSLIELYYGLACNAALLAGTAKDGTPIVEDLSDPENPKVYRLLPPPSPWGESRVPNKKSTDDC